MAAAQRVVGRLTRGLMPPAREGGVQNACHLGIAIATLAIQPIYPARRAREDRRLFIF
jgi:hypothetical protein